jgi:hypothetical protein
VRFSACRATLNFLAFFLVAKPLQQLVAHINSVIREDLSGNASPVLATAANESMGLYGLLTCSWPIP